MNEHWKIINLSDVPASPWRNGGGVTRELAAWPPTGNWQWRLSVAEVDQNGPFSKFEGVDRWLAVLDGAGVVLAIDDERHILTSHDAPFFFDGGVAADCELIEGRTRDFNLMVRKTAQPSCMLRIGKDFSMKVDTPKTIAVYAGDAGATVQFNDEILHLAAHSLAWRDVVEHASVTVEVAESASALWMEISA